MDYRNLNYLLKVREQINGLFVWSIWGDGERMFCRVQDEKGNVFFKPFGDVL